MSATAFMPETIHNTMSPAKDLALRERILDSIEERRSAPRQRSFISASLRAMGASEVFDCPADDISEGGMRITAPIGFGLAVGQRLEVMLRGDAVGGDGLSDGHYATVVRTELLLDRGSQDDRVGVGLRFDQPVLF